MDNKILELLFDMQKDMKNMQKDVKNMQKDMENMQSDIKGIKKDIDGMKNDISGINYRLDKIEFKVNDGFETLELLSKNNSNELNRLKIKVSKLENRIKESNIAN